MPAELAAALKEFRAEGPKGWSFVQTTAGENKSLVERFDPLGKNFVQWTLLKKDGVPPTADEVEKYNQRKASRSSNETAPNVKDQLAPDSCEIVSENAERGIYRFSLVPADKNDTAAAHMRATFTLHRPTGTIERVELASIGPFSPVFFVDIKEAATVMNYSLPTDGRPSLLQEVRMKVRGRAMWVRSLDQDLSVVYSDYVYAGKK